MSRRLEIELTSRRGDGTWTWRAAGARQPKGEVRGDLLPDSAAVGTVLRAEAEGGLDGFEIITVFAPRSRPEPEGRLELIGGGGGPLVTTRLVSARGRRSPARPARTDHDDGRPNRGRKRDRQSDKNRGRRRGRDEEHDGDDRRRGDRKPRRGSRGDGRDRRTAADSGRGRKQPRSQHSDDRSRDRHPHRSKTPRPPRPRTPALKAKRVHRKAALAALPEDQRTLAREVLKGGVPGVRKSIERMNAKAKAENLPLIKADPVLVLAEQLAPVLKAAEWHDRADAALAGISRIDLRDIRSVIAAADRAARTDETRALAESLREGLVQRLEVDYRKWLDELAATIGEGRTIRALRLSSRPPKAGTPLPPDMAERLADMASADLNPTANQQRWATVVDAVALSPVRTQVAPVGAPDEPTGELLAAIRRLAERVPQIAALFGIKPQKPSRGPRRPPPPPPAPDAEVQATPTPPSPGPDAEAAPSKQDDTPPADAAPPAEADTAEQPEQNDTRSAQADTTEQDDASSAQADTTEQDDASADDATEQDDASADDASSAQADTAEQDDTPAAETDTAAPEQENAQ